VSADQRGRERYLFEATLPIADIPVSRRPGRLPFWSAAVSPMKLAIGSDHAGYKLKSQLAGWLRTSSGGKHQVRDVGTFSEESCDYPDFAQEAAKAVAKKHASRGILLCGTGIGMAIAANKVRRIRAAVVWNPEVARMAAEHNGANVICLPARFLKLAAAKKILHVFLSTPFGGGRHLRRIKKITAMDKCS